MRRFSNILVGVDLSQQDRLVSADLTPPNAAAVELALWLAKINSADLTFFHALDVSASAQRMIEESCDGERSVVNDAQEVLSGLVARASAEGITAHMEVRFGKSWLELIRRVVRNHHDLVIAGTRHLGALKAMFVGSTGLKLLRKCPCPVWIAQPQPEERVASILVAHCLRSVGDTALELGASLARLYGAQLHVVHALAVPELERIMPAGINTAEIAKLRSNAQQHIDAQLAKIELAQAPQVHIVTDAPDFAVLKAIDQYGVQLVVMGTVARSGITGLTTGNTAELLLPQIRCSVLAVKPHGFQSPVSV